MIYNNALTVNSNRLSLARNRATCATCSGVQYSVLSQKCFVVAATVCGSCSFHVPERNSLLTVRTEEEYVFEIVCRRQRKEGWMDDRKLNFL